MPKVVRSRRQFLVLGTLTGAAALAACGAPAPSTSGPTAPAAAGGTTPSAANADAVEIVYWHGWSGRFADWLDRIGAAFTETNPDIKMSFVQIDWGELYPKLLTAVAGGNPPDTYVAGNEGGQLYSLAANGVIMAMEDIADPNDLAKLQEDVHKSIWEIGTYEGKLWAVPKWTQSYELLVNTDHLAEAGIDPEKPPQTMAELDVIADALYKRDDDGTIRRLGFDPGTWYFSWWGRFNGQYVDANGTPTATHENNKNCASWLVSYSEKYDPTKLSSFSASVSGSDAQQPFLTGMVSIMLEGPWRLGDIYEYKPDLPYTVWRLPKPEGVDGLGMSTGGDIPVIPTGVKNPQASFRWCRYLAGVDNPDVYATLWTVGLRPHMPISEKVTESAEFQKAYEMFPGLKLYTDDFFGGDWWAPPPKLPVAEFYSDRLNSNIERARLLQATVDEALETTQKEVTDELAKWQATQK